MRVYSSNVFTFIQKSLTFCKEILEKEMGLKVSRTRFLYGKYTYPLQIEVFENKNEIGYFDHKYYSIGLNKNLIFTAKDSVLRDILRHELVHYIVYIKYGPLTMPHGAEFTETCYSFNYDKDAVLLSKMNIETENNLREGEISHEKILVKIQKLINLSQSQNQFESEIATQKANELLIRYNIEQGIQKKDGPDEEEVYIDKILTYKRNSSKLHAIHSIIKHFMVYPIFNHGKNEISLDVIGKKVNVILAEAVAKFLDAELERLWKAEVKRNPHLKGKVIKNSFFLGVAKGHDEKMKNFKEKFSHQDRKALTIIKEDLKGKVDLIFKNLSHSRGSGKISSNAFQLGESAGSHLKIHTPIGNSQKKNQLFFLR